MVETFGSTQASWACANDEDIDITVKENVSRVSLSHGAQFAKTYMSAMLGKSERVVDESQVSGK